MADGTNERKIAFMGEPLQSIAREIDSRLMFQATQGGFAPWGFALVVFAHDGDEAVYTSNCERSDMIKALREMANVLEAGDDTIRKPGGGI